MSLIDDFRNGKRYGTDWKAPTVQHMNNLVETISINDLIIKSISSIVDTSEVDNYGIASVAMVGEGTDKYLKFKKLKGKGIKSFEYTSMDSIGNRIYTLTLDDGTTKTIQSDRGTGFNPRGTWETGVVYVRDTNTIDTVFYDGTSYYCKVSHTSSSSTLPTNTTYWGILCEKGQAPNIIDNLTTDDGTKALSAKQGKYLNDELTKIKNGTTVVPKAKDSETVAGVKFSADTKSAFGDYVVPKYCKVVGGVDFIDYEEIALDKPINDYDILEFHLWCRNRPYVTRARAPIVGSGDYMAVPIHVNSSSGLLVLDALVIFPTSTTMQVYAVNTMDNANININDLGIRINNLYKIII